MNRRQQINKILHDHIEVDKNTDYTNYKKLITAIEEWHEQQVKSVDLANVVCSSCGSSNKKWDRYEITLNDKDGTDVDVSVDYCEDCGHVFKMNEY